MTYYIILYYTILFYTILHYAMFEDVLFANNRLDIDVTIKQLYIYIYIYNRVAKLLLSNTTSLNSRAPRRRRRPRCRTPWSQF